MEMTVLIPCTRNRHNIIVQCKIVYNKKMCINVPLQIMYPPLLPMNDLCCLVSSVLRCLAQVPVHSFDNMEDRGVI